MFQKIKFVNKAHIGRTKKNTFLSFRKSKLSSVVPGYSGYFKYRCK